MNKKFKVFFVLFLLTCLPVVSAGQAQAERLTGSVEINGTRIWAYVPREMSVVLTPHRLRTSLEMSMLHYRFSTAGKETTYGLHWYVYVTDATGKIIRNDSWWDRGEWAPFSEVEGEAVFEFKHTDGAQIIILLQEMITSAGVRSVNLSEAERLLFEAASESGKRLPPARFVKHTDMSDDDQQDLLIRSLNSIVADPRLRRALRLKEGSVLLLSDETYDYSGVFNVEPVSQRQINDQLKRGEPVAYLECCRTTVTGRTVSVSVDHHKPLVQGNSYIRKGIRVTFVYRRASGQFTLKETKTEYF